MFLSFLPSFTDTPFLQLLPLLPTVVNVAPAALPVLALAIQVPPILIALLSLGGPVAAFFVVQAVPDDTVVNVALQTFTVGTVGLALPVAGLVAAKVLSDLTKK